MYQHHTQLRRGQPPPRLKLDVVAYADVFYVNWNTGILEWQVGWGGVVGGFTQIQHKKINKKNTVHGTTIRSLSWFLERYYETYIITLLQKTCTGLHSKSVLGIDISVLSLNLMKFSVKTICIFIAHWISFLECFCITPVFNILPLNAAYWTLQRACA